MERIGLCSIVEESLVQARVHGVEGMICDDLSTSSGGKEMTEPLAMRVV